MIILVTNDDGIHAPALRALKDALRPLGRVIIVAPDRDQPVQTQLVVALDRAIREVAFDPLPVLQHRPAERVRPVRGAQDRPTPGQDPARVGHCQRLGEARLHQPLVAVLDPHEFMAEFVLAALHHRSDERVQTRAVSAAGEDSKS